MSEDELDRAILGMLMNDGRVSGSELVRRIPASPSRIRSRLAHLLDGDDVRVTALINPALIGRPVVAMLTIETTDASLIPDLLTALPEVAWTARCASGAVYAQVNTATPSGLLALLNDSIRTLPGFEAVGSNLLLRGISRSIGAEDDEVARSFEFVGAASAELDELDAVIVRTLQQDGRTAFTVLAELTGLSVPAARQRYRRLVHAGVLTVEARPDPAFMGRAASAHVSLRVRSSTAPLVALIGEIPDVTYVAECAGESDLLLELACTDSEALAMRAAQVRALPGVAAAHVDPFVDVRTVRFYF
jgi:DNA-binding Lrp family transcriptional regulator